MRSFAVGLCCCLGALGAAAQQQPLLRPGLLAGLRLGAVSSGPSPVALKPHVTGSIDFLPLSEAAGRFGEWLGVPLQPPPAALTPRRGEAPELDLQRRARLKFDRTPVSEAIRAFCRAYGCSITRGGTGLYLSAAPPPSGPEAAAGAFTVAIGSIRSSESHTLNSGNSDYHRSSISVTTLVRSDPARTQQPRLCRVESFTLYDETGRSAGAGAPGASSASRLAETLLPDEFSQTLSVAWDGGSPRRIARIEGTLSLYQTLAPVELRVPLPASGNGTATPQGSLTVEPRSVRRNPDGRFECVLRIQTPAGASVSPDLDRSCTLELPGGSRTTGTVQRSSSPLGVLRGYTDCLVSAAGLTSQPVSLTCPVLLQSNPTVRVPFSLVNYPADLGEASAGKAVDAARGGTLPKGAKPSVAVTLISATQHESRSLIPGHPVLVSRTQSLRLKLRAQGSAAVAGLESLSFTDNAGKTWNPPADSLGAYELTSPDPNEVVLGVTSSWPGLLPSSLERLEGTVAVYPSVERRSWRIELPEKLPEPGLPYSDGPLKARLAALELKPGDAGEFQLSATVTVELPDARRAVRRTLNEERCVAHLAGGIRRPLTVISLSPQPAGGAVTETWRVSATLPQRPRALEWIIPYRAGERSVHPFSLRGVLLPIGKPITLK